MKQINGTVTLSFLEEDNQQRVIFRVVPLCTRDGFVFRERTVTFPDQGSLRIVPDKREQSTFKERMRTTGCLCAIQLAVEGKELAKVRQNRNYDPNHAEMNQFAIYSDVICEFSEDGVFEVFAEGAETAAALSPRVLIRRGQVLYGPVAKEEAAAVDALRPFGNDSYLLHTVPMLDGTERTFYWNPELTVNWRQRRGTLRRGKAKPEEGEEVAQAEAEAEELPVAADKQPERQRVQETSAPVQPAVVDQPASPERAPAEVPTPVAPPAPRPVEAPRAEMPRRAISSERRSYADGDTALPIGKRLAILDSSMTFEQQIDRLDQPVSTEANLLGRSDAPRMGDLSQGSLRIGGTPLTQAGVKVPQPIRRGEPLHYVVEKQILSARRETASHDGDYQHVENPIENLNVALAAAWVSPETREQTIQNLSANDAFMQAFMRHLLALGRGGKIVEAAQEQLQDIEAERLSLLMQLEAARNDCKRAMDALHAELSAKKREELAQLETQLQAMRAERDTLMLAMAELSEQAQVQTVSWVSQCGMQMCAANGDTVAIAPVVGALRSPAELVAAIRQMMNRQGFACNEDDATELLLHFALNDEFCICGDTVSEAEMCARALLEALGLAGVAARTYADTLLNVASLLPANGLRTPTVEVCPMGRPAINGFGHRTIRLIDVRMTTGDTPPLPVVYAPVYRASMRDTRPLEPMKPASLASFAALREEAKPLWEQGEQWFNELDRQLSEQDSALYGMATQQMRLFVSAASGRLRGGFLTAADAAVLGWVVPAVCRRALNPEPLRNTIAGLPRCLTALGIQ